MRGKRQLPQGNVRRVGDMADVIDFIRAALEALQVIDDRPVDFFGDILVAQDFIAEIVQAAPGEITIRFPLIEPPIKFRLRDRACGIDWVLRPLHRRFP